MLSSTLVRPFAILGVLAPWLLGLSGAQSGQNCPLLGPVYPPPTNAQNRSIAVPKAIDVLQATLETSLKNGTLDAANVSFYASVFSANESVFHFSHAAPGNDGPRSTAGLDEDTIFRIGSISKLITVYSVLAEIGMAHMNDPVTKWVPELAAADSSADPVSHVRWDEVTLGTLAGQISGISRDLSLMDLSNAYNSTVTEALGLPDLDPSEIPSCGIGNDLPNCQRKQFFQGLATLHPVMPSFNTPVYGNVPFQILAYALEAITQKPYADIFDSSLRKPLGLSRTSLEPPQDADNALIPGGKSESWWDVSMGDGSPFGGMFSTAADLTKVGQSILSSSVLKPHVTRQWLKPITHTADLRNSVGMPWEIRRVDVPASNTNASASQTRIVDLYTKNGEVVAYSSLLVLSPDHQFGYVILAAAPAAQTGSRSFEVSLLGDILASTLLPAFEEAAREQAAARFAGTYVSSSSESDNTTATTLVISGADDGKPGLGVESWKQGDLDLLETFVTVTLGADPKDYKPSLRLYPTGLTSDDGQVSFRGVWEAFPKDSAASATGESGPFTGGCVAWGMVDTPHYGKVAFDDFVFRSDGGDTAVSVTPRVSRVTLSRQQSNK